MHEKNKALLNALYKNAVMGTSTISTILPKVENPRLKKELETQLETYKSETNEIYDAFNNNNLKPEEHGSFQKLYADMGINVSTLINSSSNHIAEMMIQGTNMGIIEINKALNDYPDIPSELQHTAKSMLKKEQEYLDRMKIYL